MADVISEYSRTWNHESSGYVEHNGWGPRLALIRLCHDDADEHDVPVNIRIVSSKAKIGFVFARRGIVMEAILSYFLPRLIGYSRAMHLITTGAVYPSTSPLFQDLFSE